MRHWFHSIEQEYSEERIHALTAHPPVSGPSHMLPAAAAPTADDTTNPEDATASPPPPEMSHVSMAASFRDAQYANSLQTPATPVLGRRVPPPVLPSFGAMPADDELASIMTACIRKHGNLKLRRVLSPELRKLGASPGSQLNLQGSFKMSPILSAADAAADAGRTEPLRT
jgi:hypothetical protein